MSCLEPQTTHPVLWALRHIFDLSTRDIAAGAGLTRADLRRLEEQYPLRPDKYRRLHDFLRDRANEVARLSSLRITSAPAKPEGPQRHWYRHLKLQQWRDHTQELVGWILLAWPPTDRPVPRETDLSQELLQTVGRRGAPRSRVIAAMKARHSHTSIQRCAERVGVREVRRDGQRWWLPPQDLLPMADSAPQPPPAPKIRTSPRASRVQTLVETYLMKRPEGALARDVVAFVCDRAQCNVTAVHRAARDLRVVRTTRGFGPGKRTTWQLQQAVDYLHARAVDPPDGGDVE